MKKLLIGIGLLLPSLAFAVSTSTIVQNLFITDLKNNGTKCLHILNNGLVQVATSDCGSGGGTVGPSTSTYVAVFDSSTTITGFPAFTFSGTQLNVGDGTNGKIHFTNGNLDIDSAGDVLIIGPSADLNFGGAFQGIGIGNSGDGTQAGYIDPSNLTTDRQFLLPDQSGTICIVGVTCDGGISTSSITIQGVASNTFYLSPDFLSITSTGTIKWTNPGYITTSTITIGGLASSTFNLSVQDLSISSTGTIQFINHNISQFTNNSGYITTSSITIGNIASNTFQLSPDFLSISSTGTIKWTNGAGFITTSTPIAGSNINVTNNVVSFNNPGFVTAASSVTWTANQIFNPGTITFISATGTSATSTLGVGLITFTNATGTRATIINVSSTNGTFGTYVQAGNVFDLQGNKYSTTTLSNPVTEAQGGTGTTTLPAVGNVFFQNESNQFDTSSTLWWDDTNARLGIFTNQPSSTLHVVGTGTISSIVGGTPTSSNLFIAPNAGPLNFANTGRIYVNDRMVFGNKNFPQSTGVAGGYITMNGTVSSTGQNILTFYGLQDNVVVQYDTNQAISTAPTFYSNSTVQPTTSTRTNTNTYFMNYYAANQFRPLLTGSSTQIASSTRFSGYECLPSVGLDVGGLASTTAWVQNLTCYHNIGNIGGVAHVDAGGNVVNYRIFWVEDPFIQNTTTTDNNGVTRAAFGKVQNLIGYDVDNLTQASTTIGFRTAQKATSTIGKATTTWAFYANGGAPSAMLGNLYVGTSSMPTASSTLYVNGTTTVDIGSLILGTGSTTVQCMQTYVKGTSTLFYIGVNTSTYSLFATSTKPSAFCN